jgi:hypothetical protein
MDVTSIAIHLQILKKTTGTHFPLLPFVNTPRIKGKRDKKFMAKVEFN